MIDVRRGGLGPYDLIGRVAVIAGGSGGIGTVTTCASRPGPSSPWTPASTSSGQHL